jgi:predicted nuclease with RNAse H fold
MRDIRAETRGSSTPRGQRRIRNPMKLLRRMVRLLPRVLSATTMKTLTMKGRNVKSLSSGPSKKVMATKFL